MASGTIDGKYYDNIPMPGDWAKAQGELADLQRQLQQAQEERDRAERETRWASQFECSVHGTCDWSMVSTAKTCMATLSNGQPCTETLRRGPSPWDAAIERGKESRRWAPLEAQGRSWRRAEDFDTVLDGLDIAEEAMRALRAFVATYDILWGGAIADEGWFHWRDDAQNTLREALRRWPAWERGER